MQITFNSYEEMMDFMEKIQGRVSAKEEKAVTTAEEMKQHSVSDVIFCGVERLRMFKRRRYG